MKSGDVLEGKIIGVVDNGDAALVSIIGFDRTFKVWKRRRRTISASDSGELEWSESSESRHEITFEVDLGVAVELFDDRNKVKRITTADNYMKALRNRENILRAK